MSLVSIACMCNNINQKKITKMKVVPKDCIEYFLFEDTSNKVIQLNKTNKVDANVIKIKTTLLPRIFVESDEDPISTPTSNSQSSSQSSAYRFATCNHDSLVYYNKKLVSLVRIYDRIDYQDKDWRRWYQTELETHERTKTYYIYPMDDDLLFARFHLYPEEVSMTSIKEETTIKPQTDQIVCDSNNENEEEDWDICDVDSEISIQESPIPVSIPVSTPTQIKQYHWRLLPVNPTYIQEPYQSQWKQIEKEINRDRVLVQILEGSISVAGSIAGSRSLQQPPLTDSTSCYAVSLYFNRYKEFSVSSNISITECYSIIQNRKDETVIIDNHGLIRLDEIVRSYHETSRVHGGILKQFTLPDRIKTTDYDSLEKINRLPENTQISVCDEEYAYHNVVISHGGSRWTTKMKRIRQNSLYRYDRFKRFCRKYLCCGLFI